MERYWKVTEGGPVAVLMNPDELRASESWVLFHNFCGALIFENYSRAMLCLQEMKAQGSTMFQNAGTIEEINGIIARSGCGSWEIEHETILYLSDTQRVLAGYDAITYYRGGYGYPQMCFVKERLEGNYYGSVRTRVEYANPQEFLELLKTQRYEGGMWRSNM